MAKTADTIAIYSRKSRYTGKGESIIGKDKGETSGRCGVIDRIRVFFVIYV